MGSEYLDQFRSAFHITAAAFPMDKAKNLVRLIDIFLADGVKASPFKQDMLVINMV